ncbi:hypothetical protein GCM10012275_01790 [Longimycelium tulufanense]|uniref:S-adenosyl methyltransferase n=1 Tax=Longimycelium tulufanense TaxID=907463 RepID=A0A8J3FS67_9PSEU|nr:SAM-dependent methyltransferase [Longimycelium tulufanense]GGM34040.1 hypothetical protein GCM10012275_01790 [Longimycelium tulufanense]
MHRRPEEETAHSRIDVPHVNRLRDYLLGGSYHFTADRRLVTDLESRIPHVQEMAWTSQGFFHRAVTFLFGQGVRQFVHLGFGVRGVELVGEVARRKGLPCRLVYVDSDPVDVARGQLMLAQNPHAVAIRADPWNVVEDVLARPEARDTFDFAEPVALLAMNSVHFIKDIRDAARIIERYRDRLADRSYLVLSHATADIRPADSAVIAELLDASGISVHFRPRPDVTSLFTGFDLVHPGLVTADEWRPEGPPTRHAERLAGAQLYVGVARKQ